VDTFTEVIGQLLDAALATNVPSDGTQTEVTLLRTILDRIGQTPGAGDDAIHTIIGQRDAAALGMNDDDDGTQSAIALLRSIIDRVGNVGTSPLADRFDLSEYALMYPFNHPAVAVDADYWTAAGDAGGFTVITDDDEPPSRKLYTDTAQNNDYYIHGDGKYGRLWNFQSGDYTKIIFETRMKFAITTDVQALWGLFEAGAFPTGYVEPLVDCAQFFLDDGVSNNFVCRTYDADEQETASDVALDDTSYHIFKMEWTSADVKFYIDGTLKATHSTQVPDSPAGLVFLIRTEEGTGAERAVNIEYAKVRVE